MSVVMAKVSSFIPKVTEPSKGDSQRFRTDSSESRRVVSIEQVQADPLSALPGTCRLQGPLKRNVANRSERHSAGSSLSKLPSPGKRKRQMSISPPLNDFLGKRPEILGADCPLPPRKVARISHTIKEGAGPAEVPRKITLETSSRRLPIAILGGAFTNPFESFPDPTKHDLQITPDSRDQPKILSHLSTVLPTPPPSKYSSDDGLPTRPKRVARPRISGISDEVPRRVANLTKHIPTPVPCQSKNTTLISTSTPATSNASHQPRAATAVPRIQMFAKKPESSGGSRPKGGGMTNELKSLTQLNASMSSKRHVTAVVLPSSQPYSLPLVVGWDQRDVAARGLLDPCARSHRSYAVEDDSSNKKEDMDEEEKKYVEAKRRLEEAERVERFHMQALILARNRTEEARRALEEQDKVYNLRSRLIR